MNFPRPGDLRVTSAGHAHDLIPHSMIRSIIAAVALVTSAAITTTAQAQTAARTVITLEGARNIVAGAEAEAKRNGWNVTIVVADAAGEPILLQRMDAAPFSSLEIALGKARTAARFRRATKALDESVSAGRGALLSLDGFVLLEGGEPITVDGEVIGAVGVSGASSGQDAQMARAGIAALRK